MHTHRALQPKRNPTAPQPRETLHRRRPLPGLLGALLASCAFFAIPCSTRAAADEPFLKKGDVIALVGGEDMVVAGELGYLELLLTRAMPDFHLRFRSLAWEGDTVFEQRRDLNFPPLEAQLDQIGATVVLCQFGQMESLMASGRVGVPPAGAGVSPARTSEAEKTAQAGSRPEDRSGKMPEPAGGTPTLPANTATAPGLPEFIAAYDKLIERMSAGGKRRIVLLYPPRIGLDIDFDKLSLQLFQLQRNGEEFARALEPLADKLHCLLIIPAGGIGDAQPPVQRDNFHLNDFGHLWWAERVYSAKGWFKELRYAGASEVKQPLLALIRAKNRLWFDYWRVQNWAFLAGDRTEQPSSRDWRDPSKRWFPAEREQFLPLIEAKEREIDALAAQLAAPSDAQK